MILFFNWAETEFVKCSSEHKYKQNYWPKAVGTAELYFCSGAIYHMSRKLHT